MSLQPATPQAGAGFPPARGHAADDWRWQVIGQMMRPSQLRSAHADSDLVGWSPKWAMEIVKRWNAHGPDGLRDGQRTDGKKPLLNGARRAALIHALQGPSPDGGLWTGPKVTRHVQQRWDISGNPATGWKWLKRSGFSVQVPRPSHPQSPTPAQRRFMVQRQGRRSPPSASITPLTHNAIGRH